MDRLRGCNYTSDPFMGSRDVVSSWVKSQSEGTASAFHPKKGQLNQILVKRANKIETVDISSLDPALFCSQVDLDTSIEGLAGRLALYSQTKRYFQYEVQAIQPGDIVKGVEYNSENPIFCLTDKRDGHYFDLVVYPVKGGQLNGVVNYNNRSRDGASHSGDVGSLYHGIRLVPNSDTDYVIGVVGFRKRFLRMFTDQLPCLAVADDKTRTVSVIPLNLAQAVCGDSSMALLAVATRDERKTLQCVALSRQITVPNIDTEDATAAVRQAVLDAIENAKEIISTKAKPPVTPVRTEPTVQKPEDQVSDPIMPVPKEELVVIYEDGLPYQREHLLSRSLSMQTLFVGLSTGLDLYDTEEQFLKERLAIQPFERLPVLGKITGPPSALVSCPRFNGHSISLDSDFLEQSNFVEFHLSSRWNRIAANGATQCCNGLFVIHVTQSTATQSTTKHSKKEEKQSIVEQLEILNRDCLSMAGPYAIALVEIGGRLYWYRGVCWPGLVDLLPEFGDDVTEKFSPKCIEEWVSSGQCQETPWKKLDQISNPTFWFNGKEIQGHKQVVKEVVSLGMEQLAEHLHSIKDLTTAMSTMLTPEQLTPFIQELAIKLEQQVEKGLAPIKQQIKELSLKTMSGDKEAKGQIGTLIGKMREFKRKITPLTTHLHSLTSQRASSTKAADIKRLVRASTIKANVDRVKSMNEDQKFEYIESIDEWMIIALNRSITAHLKVLGGSSPSTFRDAVYNRHIKIDESIVGLLDRCPELDGTTVACLIEGGQKQQDHPMSGPSSWAMPQGQGVTDQSAFPIPILEMFDQMKSPYGVAWCELTNHPDVSTYRIGLRSTICNATASRTFNINPASKELTFFLIYLFLNIAKSITHAMTVPKQEDFDSTTCRMTRCLVGLAVTTMASGQNPACEAFTIFGMNPKVVPHNETWTISLLAQVMPYTGWDQAPFKKNLAFYLVRSIRRNLTDPATEGLRKQISAMEAKEQSDRMGARNEELRFARIAIRALFYISDHHLEKSERAQNIAERVLTRLPQKQMWFKNSTSTMANFLEQIRAGSANWDYLPHVLETAANVYARRSAYFKGVKTQLRDVLDGRKTSMSETKAVSTVKAAREQVSKYSLGGKVKVQNWKAIEALDLASIKGDAELKRSPFTLYGFEPIDKTSLRLVDDFILEGGQVDLTAKNGDKEESTGTLIPQENKAVIALRSYPSKGLDLAKRLEKLEYKDFSFGLGIGPVLETTGCSLPELRGVTETLLVNWRDTMMGEATAFNSLKQELGLV